MAFNYASAFDKLLAEGRQELAEMTGAASERQPKGAAGAAPAHDPEPERTYEGTSRGVPFRLTVRD